MTRRNKNLFILPFDHRHSFEKDLFGIDGRVPTELETNEIIEYKNIIYDGFKLAIEEGVSKESAGILVDEEFGSSILKDAQFHGYITACSVEKSGQDEFHFEYGADYQSHILDIRADYVKVLVCYNPQGDEDLNERQGSRLQNLSNFCIKNSLELMVELLIDPTFAQSYQASGDREVYQSEVRPKEIVSAIKQLQDRGVEPKIWKVEGVADIDDCRMVSEQARSNGRSDVGLIVLGGGEDTEIMKEWLTSAAITEGYIGFAIGRTVWESALKKVREQTKLPSEASREIADNFKSFTDFWLMARTHLTRKSREFTQKDL